MKRLWKYLKPFATRVCVYFKPFTNWKFLISFGLAWMITNGWCYVGLTIGFAFDINWLKAVCGTYAGILYLPFTLEKLITIPLAMWFQRILFKRDEKLKKQFEEMKAQAVSDWHLLKYKIWYNLHWHRLYAYKINIIGFDSYRYYKGVYRK